MRILAHVQRYPPRHNAGAEWSLHVILRELVRRGHSASVYASLTRGRRDHDGVHVFGRLGAAGLDRLYSRADVVVTQLGNTRAAVDAARRHRVPVVHLVHNHWHLERHRVALTDAALVVFNSRWLESAVAWPGHSIVVHPPVFPAEYRTTPGDRITLINLSESKGGNLFFELARRRPHDGFLGVMGAYQDQVVPADIAGNVELVPNTPRIVSEVYGRTRVLLVPSSYESWGRVAAEAAVSGIPVVAHPTLGLRECLGEAGIFVDREDPDRWMLVLDRLAEPAEWQRWSKRLRARALQLDPRGDIGALSDNLARVVSNRRQLGAMDRLGAYTPFGAGGLGPTVDT